ncbi:MAG: hypothetical protein LBO05_07030 [Deltaproteobacteria bacterium]|nr:hypothetical protein [Deltaproteobacteria bacterium]
MLDKVIPETLLAGVSDLVKNYRLFEFADVPDQRGLVKLFFHAHEKGPPVLLKELGTEYPEKK